MTASELDHAIGTLVRSDNALLAAADPADLRQLAPAIRRVRFGRGETLLEANQHPAAAYFVERGVVSVVKPADGERTTEISLIGPEGFAGSSIVMSDAVSPYRAFVQSDQVDALAIDAQPLVDLFDASRSFRSLLLTAIELQRIQVAENLVTALWQQTKARLARWLLMYRDRMRSDRLEVTHEFMALMVGAQRSKVTATIHELEGDGAITARRGLVIVRDDAILERLTCGSYQAADREIWPRSRNAG